MIRFGSLLILTASLAACKPPVEGTTALTRADALLSGHEPLRACRLYERVVESREASHEEFRRAARGLARCLALTGRLGTATNTLDVVRKRRGSAGAAYLRAFLALASGPLGRPSAKRLFLAAERGTLRADSVYRLGLMSLRDEDFGHARGLLARAVQLGAPAGARIALAGALAMDGRFSLARRRLSEALDSGPTVADRRRAERLASFMDELEAEMSTEVRKLAGKARALLDRGLPSQAVELLEDAKKDGIFHPMLSALLGLAHLQLGNDARAVAALLVASRGPHADWSALALLGRLYLERGEDGQARRYLERAVRLHPFDRASQHSLAVVLGRMKLYGDAARRWAKVVVLSSRSGESLREWGLALAKAGKVNEALAVLEQAVKAAPKDAAAFLALGDQLVKKYRQGDGGKSSLELLRRAKKAYRKALVIKPGDPVVLMRLKSLGVDVARLIR